MARAILTQNYSLIEYYLKVEIFKQFKKHLLEMVLGYNIFLVNHIRTYARTRNLGRYGARK